MQVSNLKILDEFHPQEYQLRAICGLQLLKSETMDGLQNMVKGAYSQKYTLDTADVQTVTFGSIITASLATIPTAELYSLTDTLSEEGLLGMRWMLILMTLGTNSVY